LLKRGDTIRDILAANLKESRRKRGITQEQFAEQAGVSTHYIAMIETCKAFPTADMLERLAKTLDIETHQLFSVPEEPHEAFERLLQRGITDIKQAVLETIQETLTVSPPWRPGRGDPPSPGGCRGGKDRV
jgi:transcriptional regulator with XRE-family HTH domain